MYAGSHAAWGRMSASPGAASTATRGLTRSTSTVPKEGLMPHLTLLHRMAAA